ncbi:MAG: peptidoglycan recognition protein family protein [Candidatus Sabulitectum sp.]|nr:peptidoglycan recognition protein family protein [Candidatus Sabulitectum sp.]
MKYLEWLQQIGCDCGKLELTEEEAKRKALPLKNPGSVRMKSIRRIVIHHSATETGNAAFFRALHTVINGWNDIGYHFVIGNGSFSDDGEIEEGRRLPFRGAHAKGGNEDSIGICLVGDFNKKSPSDAQMDSLGLLLSRLIAEYSINRDSITLHRFIHGSSTECPGKNISLESILYIVDNK